MATKPAENEDGLLDPNWDEENNWAPGVPLDGVAPTLHYQAIMGKVFTLQRWADGSTSRGEIALADLEALVDGQVREGWYDAWGTYVGTSLDLEQA